MANGKGDGAAFDAFLERAHDGYAQFLENNSREEEFYEPSDFRDLAVSPDVYCPLHRRLSITKPKPIQILAIPRFREDKDVVVRAKPGSGKTLSYLLRLVEIFSSPYSKRARPFALIILPTPDLCNKLHRELEEFIQTCAPKLKTHLMTSTKSLLEPLSGSFDVVVSTPASVLSCPERGFLQKSLELLVFDEADPLLSPGFQRYLKSFMAGVTKSCQCLVFSANPSADVKKLNALVLHNPYVLTLTEDGHLKSELFPYNFQHFYFPCEEADKLSFLPDVVGSRPLFYKVLIFTNSDDTSSTLQLFLEQFDYTSSVLLGDWTQESHILQNFNAGDSGLLIATDNNQSAEEKQAMGIFTYNVFKNVGTVCHYDLPHGAYGYHRRILSTTRAAFMLGESIAMASPGDKDVFEALKTSLGEDGHLNRKFLLPAPWYGWVRDTGVEGRMLSFEEVESNMYGP